VARELDLLPGNFTLHLWDGDTVEHKNLDRQFFTNEDVGQNKAEAFEKTCHGNIEVHPTYFSGSSPVASASLIFCCVDNHPARLDVIRRVDETLGAAIICGNELIDADAYYYNRSMKDTPNDPRVFAPEIVTDTSGSPIRATGCTGVAQQMSPQLGIANLSSAAHALRLMWWWYGVKKTGVDMQWAPVFHGSSAMKCWTRRQNGEIR